MRKVLKPMTPITASCACFDGGRCLAMIAKQARVVNDAAMLPAKNSVEMPRLSVLPAIRCVHKQMTPDADAGNFVMLPGRLTVVSRCVS